MDLLGNPACSSPEWSVLSPTNLDSAHHTVFRIRGSILATLSNLPKHPHNNDWTNGVNSNNSGLIPMYYHHKCNHNPFGLPGKLHLQQLSTSFNTSVAT